MRDNDELDSLLDKALATYGDPGVGPDLAERVLAFVRPKHGRRRPDKWLPWAVGVPALALLLLAVLFLARHSEPRASESSMVESTKPHESRPAGEFEQGKADTENTNRAAMAQSRVRMTRPSRDGIPATTHAQQLPRLKVFPAPAPLTEEERALADLANQTGDVNQSVIDRRKGTDEPIRIAEIQIPPINPPDRGEN